MGRIASTLRPQVLSLPSAGGLLLDSATDLWADWGLLGVPDPDRATTTRQGLLFRDFIRSAFPSFQFHRLSELLIDLLQQVADGKLTRLIVCTPPRHGKSQLVSRLFPAYWVSRHPQLFCAIASYSAELAYAHSREARHYYRSTGHALSKDSAAVGNWLTPQRGGCIAAGVRGPFTGKGYNLGIIDDPYKGPEDAKSALQRERLIDWLKSVWFTRAEPGQSSDGHWLPAAQVVVQTRWDHQDMTAWLLEQEAEEHPEHWTVLNLPAIAEPISIAMPIPPTCRRVPDWRQPGEALCPERVPLAVLQRIRTRLGSYWWNALYQQRPSPAEGLLFRKDWIQAPLPVALGQPRRYAPLVLSCDLSFKDGKDNDACGFALLGLLEPQRHLAVDARRQGLALAANAARAIRTGLQTVERATDHGAHAPDPWAELQIEALWAHRQQLDLPGVIKFLLASLNSLERQGLRPHAVLIEDAANGPAVCQLLRRQVPGLIAITPKGSKASRAHAVAPLVEAGQVRFARKADSLVEELLAFSPRGGIDDQVDAFTQGVLWIEAQYWRGRGHSSAPLPMVFSR
ncbi:MAG: terminase [Cyanobacteria bacterium]|nr:terminase [Cyanobacteriota bacterium]